MRVVPRIQRGPGAPGAALSAHRSGVLRVRAGVVQVPVEAYPEVRHDTPATRATTRRGHAGKSCPTEVFR